LSYIPHFIKIIAFTYANQGNLPNVNPRLFFDKLEQSVSAGQVNVSPKLVSLIQRLTSAHFNGLEAFGAYAAAILLAYVTKVPAKSLDKLARRFILLRTAYLISFIVTERDPWGAIRTLIWVASLVTICQIFHRAVKSHFEASGSSYDD